MTPGTAIPLSLFENGTLEPSPVPLKERLRSVEWSYSRRNTFEQCLLKYYFDYYGSIKRYAPHEPDKALIRGLKLRQNRYERTGEIIHEVIADYFRAAQNGRVHSLNLMVERAKRSLSDHVTFSRTETGNSSSAVTPAQSAQLVEFCNDREAAEDLYRDAEQRMVSAIQNFEQHSRYEEIRATGRSTPTEIERMFRLKNWPCRVAGVVDFAARACGVPAVVDWKSGKQYHSEDDSLQLTAYSFWGAENFGCPPEKVVVYKAFLSTGELVRYKQTKLSLDKGKRRILQDVERMVEIHQYGVEGRRRAFTPCAQSKVCILCPYLKICPEGKESVHD
jgi:hypothetical protein